MQHIFNTVPPFKTSNYRSVERERPTGNHARHKAVILFRDNFCKHRRPGVSPFSPLNKYTVPGTQPSRLPCLINMKPLNRGIVEVSIVISYYTLREKPEAIFAKWLQAMGLLIFGIGFLVFLASPLVAAKYAESAYSLAPKEIREELANLGIAQLHRNRMKETE